MVPRLLVQACEVATCYWRCVPWRGEVCNALARAARAFCFRESSAEIKSVCVREGRAAGYALWAGRKMSTAQLYTGNAASLRALAVEKPESFG